MTFLSSRQVAEKIGVKHGTIRQWRKRGKFPEPDLQPSVQAPLWAETTIDQWLAEREPVASPACPYCKRYMPAGHIETCSKRPSDGE